MEHATPAALVILGLFVGPILFHIIRAKKGHKIFVRRIPGIDAIEMAIGRAIELGRPVAFTAGLISVSPLLYASLSVLKHVSRRIAMFGSRLIVPCYAPDVLALSDATIQSAYQAERKSSSYDPASVRYLSDEQFAFASGYIGLMHRERVAAAFLFGSFAAESLVLAEAGQQVGAVQVAATTSNEQIPFFITSCDYTLIGEELFAAGAYLSEDPVQVGSLRGQDIAKAIIFVLIITGILAATYSSIIGGDRVTLVEKFFQLQWSDL